MEFNKIYEYYGVGNGYGCYDKLSKLIVRGKLFYAYRNGYFLNKNMSIRKPSVYIFDSNYFIKQKGVGHRELGGRIYDGEYQIFITEEDAIEYAYEIQKKSIEVKENERMKMISSLDIKVKDEVKQLNMTHKEIDEFIIKLKKRLSW